MEAVARIDQVCPLFAAADPGRAAAWYRDRLGFAVTMTMDDYAIVRRDGAEVHFWRCDDRHIAENTSAYFRTGDVDGLHEALKPAADGGRVIPPEDKALGHARVLCDRSRRQPVAFRPAGRRRGRVRA